MKTLPPGSPKILTALSWLLLFGACSALPAGSPESPASAVDAEAPVFDLGPDDALLAAAGDIADCGENRGAGARATGNLLKKFPAATVIAPGDIAYRNGTPAQFANCYQRLWGDLKDRTRPAPGNHDYGIYPPAHRNNAVPYFAYFGANAGPAGKGFYSFDLGAWHIVSLNSMAGRVRAAPSMDEQVRWLEGDLGGTRKGCILAFWHHPLFSSGEHGDEANDPGRLVGPLWDALAARGADVIVNGHDHDYERFALQTAAEDPRRPGRRRGVADSERGIRQFVVGTGGAHFRPFETIQPNSEEPRLDKDGDHGALFLKLSPGSYEWKFVRTDGSVGDQSQEPQACHPKIGTP